MEVSKLTVDQGKAYQPSLKRIILEYLQNYPQACRDTNIKKLAEAISLEKGNNYQVNSIQAEISGMITRNMILRYNGKRRATFIINYLHRNIPEDIVKKAPETDRIRTQKLTETVNKIINRPIQPKQPVQKEEIAETTVKPEVKLDTANGKLNLTITLNINLNQ